MRRLATYRGERVKAPKGAWFRLFGLFIFPALISLVTGCTGRTYRLENEPNWLQSGSIAIFRQMPEIDPAALVSTTAFGFSPQEPVHPGMWLSIGRAGQTVSLMEGQQAVQTTSGHGIEKISPGTFKLLHKQRSPLWHAPDSYFLSRRLKVPPQGDRARLLRGALGDFALFITRETPIHCGPLWSEEVGGIQLDENSITKIYYSLPIGATIEVK